MPEGVLNFVMMLVAPLLLIKAFLEICQLEASGRVPQAGQEPLLESSVFRKLQVSEEYGAPEKIRTSDLQLRRLPLYPAELRARPLSLA
jgi:hypothetical protein